VRLHREWVLDPHAQPIRLGKVTYRPPTAEDIASLRGMNLACNCPVDGLPCHADTLLELANR
jgi:hypothetical protein